MNKKLLVITNLIVATFAHSAYAYEINANIKPIYQKSQDAQIVGSQAEFVYHNESLYEVNCQIGHITDITLRPSEEITYIGAGDTAQWMVDKAIVVDTAHVYIKPKVSDVSTNIIINTTHHSYRLLLNSTDNYYPIVKWSFADEEEKNNALIQSDKLKADGYKDKNGYLVARPKKLNFAYKITKKKNITDVYLPLAIYDDGLKTYIKMQPNNKYDLPVLYHVDKAKKVTLVNYRIRGNLFIADRVFQHGRLIYTNKSSIDFVECKKDEK